MITIAMTKTTDSLDDDEWRMKTKITMMVILMMSNNDDDNKNDFICLYPG